MPVGWCNGFRFHRRSIAPRALALLGNPCATAPASSGNATAWQVCLIVNGHCVVDAVYGRIGAIDPRQVRKDTLFQTYEAGAAVLSTLLLQVDMS